MVSHQFSQDGVTYFFWVPERFELRNGETQALFFGHATGMPTLVYRSLLTRLAEELGVIVVSYDQPGFGKSKPPEKTFAWQVGFWQRLGKDHAERWRVANRIIKEKLSLNPYRNQWTFVGHSLGAWLSIWAAAELGLARVVTWDIVWLPIKYALPWGVFAGMRVRHLHPVGKSSRSRRTKFASREDAMERLSRKKLFKGWGDLVLQDYVDALFCPSINEKAVVLNHDPRWEAAIFRSQPASMQLFALKIPAVNRRMLKVLFVAGGRSDVCDAKSFSSFRRLFPSASSAFLPDAGHMFPLVECHETIELMGQYLQQNI